MLGSVLAMKLTRHTDYALRLLMHLAERPGRHCSTTEIAAAYGISEHHLIKVAKTLTRLGYLTAVRGRTGGVKLARPAGDITVGEIVRASEGDAPLVDCGGCLLAPGCTLTGTLAEARRAFFAVLDGRTIADVARQPSVLPLAAAPAA